MIERRNLFYLDNLIDNFLNDQNAFNISKSFFMKRNEDNIEFSLDVPGCKPEDIDIQIEDNILSVRATRKDKQSSSSKSYNTILPRECDSESVEAELLNGVLVLKFKLKDQSKSSKRIEIKNKNLLNK